MSGEPAREARAARLLQRSRREIAAVSRVGRDVLEVHSGLQRSRREIAAVRAISAGAVTAITISFNGAAARSRR